MGWWEVRLSDGLYCSLFNNKNLGIFKFEIDFWLLLIVAKA